MSDSRVAQNEKGELVLPEVTELKTYTRDYLNGDHREHRVFTGAFERVTEPVAMAVTNVSSKHAVHDRAYATLVIGTGFIKKASRGTHVRNAHDAYVWAERLIELYYWGGAPSD